MIGRASVAWIDCRHPEIAKWLHPLAKDRHDRQIGLSIEPANKTAAIIEVEIALNLVVLLGEGLDGAARAFFGGGPAYAAEMAGDIKPGADEALFFACP